MKKNSTSPLESKTDWERVRNMKDEDIDFSDIPEITAEQFAKAKPTKEFFAERGIEFNHEGPHTVTVHYEDGSTKTYSLPSQPKPIYIEPDVLKYFPNSKSVNNALHSLIALIPNKQPNSAD